MSADITDQEKNVSVIEGSAVETIAAKIAGELGHPMKLVAGYRRKGFRNQTFLQA